MPTLASYLGPSLGVLAFSACTFRAGALSPDADTTDASQPPAAPQAALPAMNQMLPPARAFLSWKDGVIPAGRTVSGYDVCSTTGAETDIDQDEECPNLAMVTGLQTVLDSLAPQTTYRWKVRARFDDGSNSPFSGIQTFMTDDSVLAWWRLDEGTGNTAADAGPGGNNAALNGSPAWVAGRSGQALQFNGVSFGLIGDRSSLEGMTRLSVETWLKTSTNGATRHIVSKWSAVDRSFALRTGSNGDGRLTFQTFTAGAVVLTSNDPFNDGNWHHVIGTYDGAAQQLYVDLLMQASGAQSGMIANTTSEMCLAESCNGGATGFGFDGTVDEAAVYNRDLSAEERTNSYCAAQAAGGVDPLPAECR